eukprot:NP_497488.2 Uncharacterized protein CELE_Y39A3B.3 [Caenorhabditis elegans]
MDFFYILYFHKDTFQPDILGPATNMFFFPLKIYCSKKKNFSKISKIHNLAHLQDFCLLKCFETFRMKQDICGHGASELRFTLKTQIKYLKNEIINFFSEVTSKTTLQYSSTERKSLKNGGNTTVILYDNFKYLIFSNYKIQFQKKTYNKTPGASQLNDLRKPAKNERSDKATIEVTTEEDTTIVDIITTTVIIIIITITITTTVNFCYFNFNFLK